MKQFLKAAIALTVLAMLLSGCQLYAYNYRDNVLEYAMISDSGNLSELDQYPNLEYVDLRGSTCYEEILTYAENHPDVTVRYNVQLGGKSFDAAVTEVALTGYETDYALLLQNLKYLPNLQSVHVNELLFTKEQLDTLIGSYPNVSFSYTVKLCGRRYDHTITELDLTHLTSADINNAISAISLLPELTSVNLSGSDGENNLSVTDVKALTDACPGVSFQYEFSLFGQTVSTLDKELVFDTVEIGNTGVDTIREALGIMKNCTYVKLDSCGIDNEIMAQLRADYPGITIAWRVFAGRFSIMTDEEMLRMTYTLTDEQAEVLKYCNKIKYMDLLSSKITNIDFVAQMPALECAIFTLTRIKDLSPLANCPNLVWLELSSCSGIKDLTPLSGLQNLKYLNISYTKATDLTALDAIPLERFNCVRASVKDEALETFVAKHPDCFTVSKGTALGYGWRYDDKNQRQEFSYYTHIQEVFRYNDKSFKGNTKEQ